MKCRKKKHALQLNKCNNKGITLIELIVTTLIMSMVVGIVVIFVASSRNSYIVVHNEAIMQTEAEIAMTYITDIAEEASAYRVTGNYSISDGAGSKTYNALVMKAIDSVPYYYFIVHDVNACELKFCRIECSDEDKLKWTAGTDKDSINNIDVLATLEANNIYEADNKRCFLADYVTAFNPVIPENNKGLLQVSLEFEYGDSSYSAGKNITSRNIRGER